MTIQDLLSPDTPPLQPADSVEHALGLILEARVRHLPVVDREGGLVGLVSEDQLLDAFDPDLRVADLLGPRPLAARPEHHVFEVTKVMIEHDLTALPVATDEGHYLGVVQRHDIFEQFARMLSTQESGAIVAIEVQPRDYSLAQLVHMIEQNDVKVLSVASEMPGVSEGDMRVTLKLNVTDASRVRHMLEHFGYRVVASFGESDNADAILRRVEEFMRYLDV